MTNFKMFLEKLEKLTLKEQKEVIAKIFGLGLVFLYSVDLEEEKIVFKVYDGRYYQFNFCFDNISYLDSFFSGWCLYSFSNSFKLIGR